jgi:hypothetical protein
MHKLFASETRLFASKTWLFASKIWLFASKIWLPARTPRRSSAMGLEGHKAPVWPRRLSATLGPWAITGLTMSAAFAQQPVTNYTTVDVASGKQVQLTYHATAKKDCTPLEPPTVKVTTPPKEGVLMIRSGTLATDRFAGCGRLKVPAQVVFYQAREGYVGSDHVSYDVTDIKGAVSSYDVTINVKAGPAVPPASKPKGTSI